MKIELIYQLFIPGGNDTALVEGDKFDNEARNLINKKIMELCPNVEQVGFLNLNQYKLTMAGGEFCGNATRSAAYYYLKGRTGEIEIDVGENFVKAGVDEEGKAWSEIPLYDGNNFIKEIDDGIHEILLKGIKHIVLDKDISKKYLTNSIDIKTNAMNIINKYKIECNDALGVIFIEEIEEKIKIHPVVWVKKIDTLFYETACGSGTTAVALLKVIKNKKSQIIDIIQPSNQIITVKIDYDNGIVKNAIISGNVITDNIKRNISINI